MNANSFQDENLDGSKPMLAQLRELHPVSLGAEINGKKVTSTYFKIINGERRAYYRLDFDSEEHEVI